MVIISHQREKCIGCNYCVELAFNQWRMSKKDGKSVLLHIKRRRWTLVDTGTIIKRDWNLIAKGTRITSEFASFLKGIT